MMLEALQIAFIAMPFVMAAVLALLLCMFVVAACGSPTVGLMALGLLCWFDTLVPGAGPLDFGVKIYVPDIVCSLIGLVAVLRALFVRGRPPILLAWYVFVLSVGVSFVFGIGSFGTAAGTALRPYFYALASASYLMSFALDEAQVRRLVTGVSWIALGLVGIVIFRWVVVAVPIAALLPPSGSFDETGSSNFRTVGAEDAALIAQVFIVGLFYAPVSALLHSMRPLVPLLLIAIIGLQHRSVWVALLAGLGARFTLPAAGRRGSTQVIMLVLVMSVLAVPAVLSGRLGTVTQDISRSASRAVAMTDTAQARFDSWKFALGKWRDGGPRAIAIGLPLGTSMDRYTVTSTQALQRISFQAHNYYVQTLFNFGLLGLGANLLVYGWVLRQLYRHAARSADSPFASAMLVVLVLQLGFFVTYGVHYMQGVFLGMAAAYAMTLRVRQGAVLQAAPSSRAPAQGLVGGVLGGGAP